MTTLEAALATASLILKTRIARQAFNFSNPVKPISLLLLIPLGFAIGLGIGSQKGNPQRKDHDSAPSTSQLEKSHQDLRQQKISHWRERFLAVLEIPSASLRNSSYYAFAQEVPSDEISYALEAIYPEGWVRYRGDVPLALFLEGLKHDPAAFAIAVDRLVHKYQELHDNVQGVFFNLGLLNTPGTIDTILRIRENEKTEAYRSRFIDGIRREHPQRLFATRLALLGPETVFRKLSDEELDPATTQFWSDPNAYLSQGVSPAPELWFEIGKRFGNDCIKIDDTDAINVDYLYTAIACTNDVLSPNIQERFKERWIARPQLAGLTTEEEAGRLLTHLINLNASVASYHEDTSLIIWNKGLTLDLAQKFFERDDLSYQTRKNLVRSASKFYDTSDYIALLANESSELREPGILSLLNKNGGRDALEILQRIPENWNSDTTLKQSVDLLIRSGGTDDLLAFIDHYGPISKYLPQETHTAQKLWSQAPELYLASLEGLDDSEKSAQLSLIAQNADLEELSPILESGTLEQQTSVLIDLMYSSPTLSFEILKHESAANLSPSQANEIGGMLALNGNAKLAVEYFENRTLELASDQTSLLTYFLGQPPEEHSAVAQLSPQHDYLYRLSNAITDDRNDLDAMETLHRENPDTFISNLKSVIDFHRDNRIAEKASSLLKSTSLSPKERLAIYQALYR